MVCHSLFGSSELISCSLCDLCTLSLCQVCICSSCSLDSFLISGFDILSSRKCIDLICYSLCCLCIVNILDRSLCSCNCIVHICYCLSYLCFGHVVILGNCICSGDCRDERQSRISVHRLLDRCAVCICSCDSLVQRSLVNSYDINSKVLVECIVVISICWCICRCESIIAHITHAQSIINPSPAVRERYIRQLLAVSGGKPCYCIGYRVSLCNIDCHILLDSSIVRT